MEDLVMFGGAYRGRRVFVTGHTGFKGAWLTLWLLDLGAEITGFALDPPTTPSLFETAGVIAVGGRHLRHVRGDVRDMASLHRALALAEPEIVFHLAAQPLVRRSYAEPRATYETNVMGVVNLLEAVRGLTTENRGPRVVVNVTTDKCYENLGNARRFVEADPLGGFDPYSSSKACSELITAAYRRSFFTRHAGPAVATARAGNVLGGGDWGEDRILPDCVRALTAGRAIEVRNSGAVRPWQHVLEPLSGYLCLAAALLQGPLPSAESASPDACAWNFGPAAADLVTVATLADTVVRAWGTGSWRRAGEAEEAPHESGTLMLDAGKAQRELGWRPAWDSERAVEAAVRWYKGWARGADAELLVDLCREDIRAYAEAAAQEGASWTAAPPVSPAPGERR